MNEGMAAGLNRRRVLVLLDSMTAATMPDKIAALERDGAIIKVVEYPHLMSQVDGIRQVLDQHQIDFVLFSRNDQVFDRVSIGPLIRALGVGYSSFSGLDTEQAMEQTAACLDDYLAPGRSSALREPAPIACTWDGRPGTFSLVFDLEQLGCVRFGLPRILDVLARHQVTATFFTTNFIREIYADVIDILAGWGHEVGLHGEYHEYLAGHPPEQQMVMIRRMKRDFEAVTPVSGANFIGRLDANTLDAMIANDLEYFVLSMEHRYSPFAYRKMPLRPMLTWSPRGRLWLVPLNVETNNRPWLIVKNMIDSTIASGRAQGWPHVSILMHPFRDGSLRHIGDLDRMLRYMRGTLGYQAIPVRAVVKQLSSYQPSSFIYYGLDRARRPSVDRRYWRGWWHHAVRYQQRICDLYRLLDQGGRRPALCFHPPDEHDVYAVYPHIPAHGGQTRRIEQDPLQMAHADKVPGNGSGSSLYAFMPRGYAGDVISAMRTSRPRFREDYTGLLPEVAIRVAYRLSAGRHIF